MASLVVTAHYNTSVSEEISAFAAWSTGNDQASYKRHFGCREIKVPSAPIFFSTAYRFITVTNAFFNILINHYIIVVNRHLYLNIMYRCCGSDRRNNLRVRVSDWFAESIDARLSVNVLPSLYFQMCHHAMYMNNDHHFCICFMHMYC